MTGHYRRISKFLDYLDEQEISYFLSYDEVAWDGKRNDGLDGSYIRKMAFICVPDQTDQVLLRLRFGSLPLDDTLDLRGPWRPTLAHDKVELDV